MRLAGAYAFLAGCLAFCGRAARRTRWRGRWKSRSRACSALRRGGGGAGRRQPESVGEHARRGRRGDPAGMAAMRKMARVHPDGRASDAMILFLVVNTSSVQLLPTTMIALRAQAGAANPADIVLPTLLATAASTLCGIAACRAFARCGA
ncbi:MAG: hypothetical protein ACLS6G_01265 [Christensenellales bacterium]